MLAASPAAPAAPLPKNLAPLRFSGALFVFRAHLYQNTAASPFLQERCRANWVRGRKSVVLLAQVLFQTCPQFYILHFTFYTYHFILIEPFRTRPPCLPPGGKVSRVVLRRATKEGRSPLCLLAAPRAPLHKSTKQKTPRPPLLSAPTHQQNKKTARRAPFYRSAKQKTARPAPLYRSAKQKTARRAARRSRIIKSKDMFTSSRSSNRCTACRKAAP